MVLMEREVSALGPCDSFLGLLLFNEEGGGRSLRYDQTGVKDTLHTLLGTSQPVFQKIGVFLVVLSLGVEGVCLNQTIKRYATGSLKERVWEEHGVWRGRMKRYERQDVFVFRHVVENRIHIKGDCT
ncbi:hypothetical protein TNCV_3832271 [Trichonephila clavipes]|nr:hypothetical protein TNCV_3832271 [Trichonephila clavipes]